MQVCMFGKSITKVSLCSSYCFLRGATQLWFISIIMMVTFLTWLGQLLWHSSNLKPLMETIRIGRRINFYYLPFPSVTFIYMCMYLSLFNFTAWIWSVFGAIPLPVESLTLSFNNHINYCPVPPLTHVNHLDVIHFHYYVM